MRILIEHVGNFDGIRFRCSRGDEKNFSPYEKSLNITSFQEHSEERENALF